jgi:hypothetical protein
VKRVSLIETGELSLSVLKVSEDREKERVCVCGEHLRGGFHKVGHRA